MKQYGPIGRREQPCPEYSESLEEAIQQQLEEHDEATVQAFIDYCDDRIDAFLEHEANRRREHAEEIKREAA
jgi:protoheme ferro-lyase